MKATHRSWWAPPADHLSASLVRQGMPRTLFGFVRRVSAWSQLWVACLTIAVFVLNTVPLEMRRRILNAAVLDGDVKDVLMLAVIYTGVVLSEGLMQVTAALELVLERCRRNGETEAGQIRRDDSMTLRKDGNQVPEHVRRGREVVQQKNRRRVFRPASR